MGEEYFSYVQKCSNIDAMTLLNFETTNPTQKGGKKGLKIVLGMGALVGTIALGSTLAASVNLNSGSPVEFGQGVAQTTACDGNVVITPYSQFVNEENGGSFKLSAINVSDINLVACSRKDFVIKAYGASSTPLNFISGVSSVTVSNDESGFYIPQISGIVMSDYDNSSFNLVIDSADPTSLQASEVNRFTIESLDPSSTAPVRYNIGDIGPGGGIIFYVDRSAGGFDEIGAACSPNCHHLEFAPKGWASLADWPDKVGYDGQSMGARANENEDPFLVWSDADFSVGDPDAIAVGTNIGTGFINTQQLNGNTVYEGKSPRFSFRAALNYVGAGTSSTVGQWFLPSIAELNELCKYARGQTSDLGNLSVQCSKVGTSIDSNLGFNSEDNVYLSSSYGVAPNGFIAGYKFDYGSNPLLSNYYVSWGGRVRPIRAF
jgi:hypothetical protein